MSSAVFGAPGGVSLAIGDLGQLARTDLTNAEAQSARALLPGKLAAQPVDLAHQAALGRLAGAQADASLAKQAQAKAMQDAAKNFFADEGNKNIIPEEFALRLGKTAIQAGDIDTGMDLLKNAGVMAGHRVTQEEHALRAKNAEMDGIFKRLDWAGRFASTVTDPQTYDNFNKQYEGTFKEKPPWTGMPYSPGLMQEIQKRSVSVKDQMAANDRERRADEAEKQNDIRSRIRNAEYELKKVKEEAAAAERERKAKIGAENFKEPPKESIDSVKDMILSEPEFKNVPKNNPALNQFARSIEVDARKMVANNGSIEPEAARQIIFQRRKGELSAQESLRTTLTMGLSPGPADVKYNSKNSQAEGSVNAPRPWVENEADRVPGQYYEKGGRTVQWAKDPSDGKYKWKVIK